MLVLQSYNAALQGLCFPEPNYPPNCIEYENGVVPDGFTVPCGRGDLEKNPFGQVLVSICILLLFV